VVGRTAWETDGEERRVTGDASHTCSVVVYQINGSKKLGLWEKLSKE
jgi:hypothetical protein